MSISDLYSVVTLFYITHVKGHHILNTFLLKRFYLDFNLYVSPLYVEMNRISVSIYCLDARCCMQFFIGNCCKQKSLCSFGISLTIFIHSVKQHYRKTNKKTYVCFPMERNLETTIIKVPENQ